MNDDMVTTTRKLGWVLAISGILALGAIGVYQFLSDPGITTSMKFIIAAIYGGGALLLLSVLRQRLKERKSDRYKDVEI